MSRSACDSQEEIIFKSEQWYRSFQRLNPLIRNDLQYNDGEYRLVQALYEAAPNQNEFIDALSYFICEKEYLGFLVATLKHQIIKQNSATIFREDTLSLAIFRDVLIHKTRQWHCEICLVGMKSLSLADIRVLTDSRSDNYRPLCSFVSGFLDRILQSKLPEDVEEILRDMASYVSKTLNMPLPEASAISLGNLLILRGIVPSLYYCEPSTTQQRPFIQCQKIVQSIFNNQTVSSSFPATVHGLVSKYLPLVRAWMEMRLRPEKVSSPSHVVVLEEDLLPEVDYKTWDNAQVCLWLTRIDMGKFVSWAQKNELCGSDLRKLDIDDLEDSTVSSSEKYTLMCNLQVLKSERKGILRRSDSPKRIKSKKIPSSSSGSGKKIANSRASSREFEIT